MNRRDAIKAVTALAGTTGLTVTPVTTKDVDNVDLMILRVPAHVTRETREQLMAAWREAMKGTSLDGVRTVVLDGGLDVEFVRGNR